MATGSDLLRRASTILQDSANVRWPLAELADWLNDALRAIVLAKPSASPVSVVLDMEVGTLQSLTDVTHLSLLRVPRNIKTAGPPRIGGRMIRVTTRDVLDASAPDWHDPDVTPYSAEVRQYVFDEENPREFYVYPGNDGTGLIEAVVCVMPALLVADGDPTLLASYGATISLPEPWTVVILDYILYRAYDKDALGADPGKSAGHFQAFSSAVGIKLQVEGANSPNARAKVTST